MVAGVANHGQAETPLRNYIGKPLPEYVTGDECLFCHRNVVGPSWSINEHQKTLLPLIAAPEIEAALQANPALKPFAKHVRFVLGNENQIRLLRKSQKYGHLDLLSAILEPSHSEDATIKLRNKPPFQWDTKIFGQRCAGCHATAVDSRTQTYAATGIDCYSCHGDVDLKHANDASLVYLSKKRNDSPLLVAATCGQCHIRTGKSKASGFPYANNHVIGSDLFTDFDVDLSHKALDAAPPHERHILANIRNVLEENDSVTCLSCHNIHRTSGRKHRKIEKSNYCLICHAPSDMKQLTYNRKERHHALCGY
ncbi:MAG: hypothetical protein M2R45_02035 [Verrucomicrobia subdivision 3 bacterium]|nr:hypothetical protein [Limisphaerales bacterium]MCS1414854.1 hypothetical protein [Limisphaerales bacterium]